LGKNLVIITVITINFIVIIIIRIILVNFKWILIVIVNIKLLNFDWNGALKLDERYYWILRKTSKASYLLIININGKYGLNLYQVPQ
jgi:hypothetical protein